MVQSGLEKERAIALRREGLSYREILSKVSVAKSTLGLWFKDVGLSQEQKQRLTQKRIDAALRGAAKRREQRILATQQSVRLAREEFKRVKNQGLWLAGVMLYWAEGSKQKSTNVSQGVKFSNSDPAMIRIFLQWLKIIANIPLESIKCELYIHQNGNTEKAIQYWNQHLTPLRIAATYFKKNKILTVRKNTGDGYNGLVTLRVRRSTNLNRKITAWTSLFLQHQNLLGSGVIGNTPAFGAGNSRFDP